MVSYATFHGVEYVVSALAAVGQTIALVFEHNPFKIFGSKKIHGRISQTLNSWIGLQPYAVESD